MTKNVRITVSGKQILDLTGEDITEIIVPGEYHFKAGKHFLLYEEAVEGTTQFTKNLVRFTDGFLEVDKKGPATSHMLFENHREFITPYRTPYGELLMEFDTEQVTVKESPSRIIAKACYGMKINGEHTAECELTITVEAAAGA